MAGIAEQAWNKVRGDEPEYAAVDPDFRARLDQIAGAVQAGLPDHGIQGLEAFEAEVRKSADVQQPTASASSVDSGLQPGSQQGRSLAVPQGTGAQEPAPKDQVAKAQKDAAGAHARVEADAVHSPTGKTAARILSAEAPGSPSNPTPEASKKAARKSGSKKSGAKKSTKTAAKKGGAAKK